ncbi:EEF1A lysine methyltransferase 3-like [Heptranchias perlo]|uniref:EEF1A lysine methyltransferase 3-like n=1 Tax=Heptranchias perlo TaxID=212740 RepID=UPI00355A2B4D
MAQFLANGKDTKINKRSQNRYLLSILRNYQGRASNFFPVPGFASSRSTKPATPPPKKTFSAGSSGSQRIHQDNSRGRLERMTTARFQENSGDDAPKEGGCDSTTVIFENKYEFCGYSLKITRFINAHLGYSAYVWQAGIALCRYFEKEKINFTGKKVIELGSGTGIVGILAALLGGDVTMTDKPNTLKQIENNVSINIPTARRHRLKVSALTWGENHTDFPTDYDFILGSDIVYSSVTYPALIETLRHLSNRGTTIYLSSELRKINGSSAFHGVHLPQYFNCQVVDRLEDKDIIVYKMTNIGTRPGDGLQT